MNDINLNTISDKQNPIRAFDIWVACLPQQDGPHVQHGIRPVVIVSNDHINQGSSIVTIVPLTSQRKKTSMQSRTFERMAIQHALAVHLSMIA